MTGYDLVIRIAGESGEGIITAGDIFTLSAARCGYHVHTFRTYPAEIRGGPCMFQLRLGNRPVMSLGDELDVFCAFNQENYDLHIADLGDEGVLVYDPDAVTLHQPRKYAYAVPFTRISKQDLNFPRGKNLVALGSLYAIFGIESACLEGVVKDKLGRKADLLSRNMQSMRAGFDWALTNVDKCDPYRLNPGDHVDRLVMSGNEAIVAGALAAGCRFFAGYPITPATDILEGMAQQLPKIGGNFLQAEDEIAALAAAIGASFSGTRAMTATSGPGFSLMTELLGLAGMAEVPVVVVDSQRGGPSTGMPTKTEQCDLNHAIFGGHGDPQRMVLAMATVEDCFTMTVRAFDLAERYQMPVVLLSDQSLSHRTETLAKPAIPEQRGGRLRPTADEMHEYRRYRLTDSGVSPMAVPGVDAAPYIAEGLEHDEEGHPNCEPAMREAMVAKRMRKLDLVRDELGAIARYGVEDPEVGILSWGSSEGSVREGIEMAAAEGYKVAGLHPRFMSPLAEGQIAQFIKPLKHLIIAEVNATGQFANLLGSKFAIEPVRLNKCGGWPFRPTEILRAVKEVSSRG